MATDDPPRCGTERNDASPAFDAARAYRDILDATGDAIFVHDAETGQILDVNRTMLEMYGCTREEIGRLRPTDLTASVEGCSTEEAMRLLRLAADGHPQQFQWMAKTKAGTPFPVEVILRRTMVAGQARVLATVRDISLQVAAEDRLRARERDFRNLIENVPGLVYRCEVEAPWRMLYMSEGAAEVTGRHPEAFISGDVPFADIIFPEDLPRVIEAVTEGVTHREPYQIEYRIGLPEGGIRWVFDRGRATYGSSGKPVFLDGVILDITSRKEAEEASRKTEERYRTLYAAMDEGFALHALIRDDADRVTDYRILDANPSFARVTGIPRKQVIGKTATEAYGVPTAPYLEVYRRVAETGHPEWFEAYFPPMEKHFSISVFSPSPDVFATVFYDITARKKAENALRESEARFRAMFEQVAVGVAQIESRTGRFVRINRKYCDIVGFTPEEMLSRTSQEITHPDDSAEDLAHMQRLLTGEIRHFSMEKRYVRKDGSFAWANLTVSPMWQPGEEPDYHVAVVEDITERRHAEEEQARFFAFSTALFMIAGTDGIIQRVNPAWEQVLGCPACEMEGRPFLDFVHPDDLEATKEETASLADGKTTNFFGSSPESVGRFGDL